MHDVFSTSYRANIYMLKFNNRNIRKSGEICSKLTILTSELRQLRRSGVFIVNFEHISNLFLVFQLLTLNKQMLAGYVRSVYIFCLSSLLYPPFELKDAL